MIDRELIEQIVTEVLKKLITSEKKSIDESKHNLLMVGDQGSIDSELLKMIESKWNLVQYNPDEEIELHTVMKVVFLDASQDLLAKGALGICDTPESELLSSCILEYVPVSIIPTARLRRYIVSSRDQKTNKDYLSQLLGYKEKLMKFGVRIESLECFIGIVNESVSDNSGKREKGNLLTQRDVQVFPESKILVDRQTIITPLARDTAREMGKSIEVIEQKGLKLHGNGDGNR